MQVFELRAPVFFGNREKARLRDSRKSHAQTAGLFLQILLADLNRLLSFRRRDDVLDLVAGTRSLDKEINSLTMAGVGSGTTIDHIEITYAKDDAYEWFGGPPVAGSRLR